MNDIGSMAQLVDILSDNVIHTIIAVIVALPLALAHRPSALKVMLLAAALGSLIDLDHFVAAGSLSLYAATHLPIRPASHSITFAAALALASLAVTRANWALAWIVFASITSHVLRDASGGATQLLYPLAASAIPFWLYAAGELLLVAGSLLLARRGWLPFPPSRLPQRSATSLTPLTPEAEPEGAHSHSPH